MNTPKSLITVSHHGTPLLVMSKETLDTLPEEIKNGLNVNSYLNYLETVNTISKADWNNLTEDTRAEFLKALGEVIGQ